MTENTLLDGYIYIYTCMIRGTPPPPPPHQPCYFDHDQIILGLFTDRDALSVGTQHNNHAARLRGIRSKHKTSTNIYPMLAQRWASVVDNDPT